MSNGLQDLPRRRYPGGDGMEAIQKRAARRQSWVTQHRDSRIARSVAATGNRTEKGRRMEIRRLGSGGPEISAISFGCMRMTPTRGANAAVGGNEAIATIHAALDAGVTLLNTGDFYAMGANDMQVGRPLRSQREQAFVSVKFAIAWVLGQGRDLVPLVGISNRARVSKNHMALDVRPGDDDLA